MIREHQYRNDEIRNGPCTYLWYLEICNRPREEHEEVDYITAKRDDEENRLKNNNQIN